MKVALYLVALLMVPTGAAAQDDTRSLLQVQLDSPIACPRGEQRRVAARTPRELFGDAWAAPWMHVRFDEPTNLVRVEPPVLKPTRRMRKSTGSATVMALLDAQGALVEAHVVCSSDDAFDAEFLRAMDRGRFSPPTTEGIPMPTLMRQEFSY